MKNNRLTLYTNFNAVCGQKVEFLLRHAKLSFNKVEINLRQGDQHKQSFLKLNPIGQVPVLVHNDKIVTESNQICLYIDQHLLNKEYTSLNSLVTKKVNDWLNLVDNKIHPACSVISWSIAIRPAMLEKTEQEVEQHFASIPDKTRRERQVRAFRLGLELPELREAIQIHQKLIKEMNQQLQQTLWLAGNKLTLADFCVIPYIIRLKYLSLDKVFENYPFVKRWLKEIEQLLGFQKVFIDNYPSGFVQRWKDAGEESLKQYDF
ncbi:glutathione S-transferase family protein [Aliikangiella sp. IMCC44359]|uniref:glutathione S-transferase family protein n=1 Tax=Aliikangiella sp. IMCC44359 TaxID=3459125 RepID=UPI00403B2832